jgi:hypothetical protein
MCHSELFAEKVFPIHFQDGEPTLAGECYRTGYRPECNGFE